MEERAYNHEEASKITHKILSFLDYKSDHYSELLQAGLLGYLQAIRDYKDDQGTKFSTFAFQVIKRKLITQLNYYQYPSNKWTLTGDLNIKNSDGDDIDEDRLRYHRKTYPEVYDFKPEDETEMLKNMQALFIKNWNTDYSQRRACRNEILEKYWSIILDRYNGMSNGDICKKHGMTYKALDNILKRIFRCMRRQPKPSDVVKFNKKHPRKKNRTKPKRFRTLAERRKERTQKARLKNFRGIVELL
jgi:RNA polymerase sigma factor (sigma-70 family)